MMTKIYVMAKLQMTLNFRMSGNAGLPKQTRSFRVNAFDWKISRMRSTSAPPNQANSARRKKI